MADDVLGLKITGGLNYGLSLAQINKDLKILSAHPSLQKLKVNISIDENFINNLSSFSKNINVITQQLNQQNVANNNLNSGLKNTTQTIENQTKATNEAIAAEKRWQVEREKINSKGIKTTTYGNTANNDKQVVTTLSDGSIKNIDNIQNQIKDTKELQSLIEQMYQGRISSATRVRDFEKQWNDTQQKAIQTNADLERSEIAKTQQSRKSYEEWYLKAIREREIQDSKTYTNLNNKLSSSKASSVSGIESTKALDLLDRKYSEINQKVLTLQSSGRQLTESELAGINRRIEALKNLASRQKQMEKDSASLTSTQLRTEALVNNLTSKYGSNIDSAKLRSLLNELKALDTATVGFKGKSAQLIAEINRIGAEARNSSQHVRTLGETLGTAFSRIAMYAGLGSIFYSGINALKEMGNTIVQVDSQMSQLYRVMDDNTDFEGMLERNIELSNQLAQSLSSVNDVAIEFGRMGFGDTQIESLTRSAILAQNISEMSAKESVDAIVAGMVNFNIAAEDSISIIDQLNQIDNDYSVTSKDLALTLTKSGSAAYTFGRSLQGLLADSTAVSEATRETGSITGNFLKSLYSRLTTMDKSEGLLAEAGVSMRDFNGEVKDADQLIPELAANWANLTKETQRNVSVGLAGRNHLNRFAALMNNFSTSISASETALNSQGSATRENTKHMQSLEARITKMKVAWETFSISMGNSVVSDVIKLVTALLGTLGKTFTFLVEKFGGLPVIFGVLNAALFLTASAFKAFTLSLASSVARLFGIVPAATAAAGGLKGVAAAANIAKISLRGLLASTVVGAALVAVGYGLEWLIGKFSDTTDEVGDLTTKMEDLDQKSTDLSSLKSLSAQYEELTKKVELTSEEKIKLANIESQLNGNHGLVLQSIEGQTGAVEANTEAIKKRISALQTELTLEREKANLEFQADQIEINKQIEEESKKVAELSKTYEASAKKKDEFFNNINTKTKMTNENGQWSKDYSYEMALDPNIESNIKGIQYMGTHLAAETLEAQKKYEEANTNFETLVKKKSEALKGQFANHVDMLESQGKSINSKTKEFADAYATIIAKTPQNSTTIFSNFQKSLDMFQTSNVQSLDEAIALFEKLPGITELTGEQISILKDTLSQYNFTPVYEGVEGVGDTASEAEDKVLSLTDAMFVLDDAMNGSTSQMDAFNKSVANGKSEIELINSAQDEMAKKGYLSVETLAKLTETFGDFTGVVGLGKDAIVAYMNKKEQERVASINSEIDKTKNLIKNAQDRIATMEAEMRAIDKLRSSYGDLVNSGQMTDLEAERRLGTIAKMKSDSLGLTAEKQTLAGLQAKLGVLSYISADYTSTSKGDSSSSTKDKATKTKSEAAKDLAEFKDATQQRINAINAQHEAQAKLNETYSASSSAAESNKQYAESIKQQKNLISGQVTEIQKLNDANKTLNSERSSLQSKNKNYNMSSWVDVNGEATQSFMNLYNSMSSKTAQESLQTLFDKYQQFSQAIIKNNETIKTTTADQVKSSKHLRELYFTQSESFIETESEKMRQSGKSEVEIAQFVLDSRKRMASEKWSIERKLAALSADEQMSADKKVYEASKEYNQKRIEDTKRRINKIEQLISASNAKIQALEGSLTDSLSGSYKPGSLSDYNTELFNHISLLQQNQAQQQVIEANLRKQMSVVDITKEDWEDYNAQLLDNIQTQIDIANSISSTSKSIKDQQLALADDIISLIKEGYETQKEIALENIDKQIEAIDKELDAFQDAQDVKVKLLDEEISKLEEVYAARMDLIDEQESEEDYQKKLSKAQDEAQKTRDSIAALSRSNDLADKKRRKDLEEKLADQIEAINDMQHDREVDLRKKSLQDELNAKKTELDKTKTTEQEKTKNQEASATAQKNILNDLKLTQEKHYNDLINDERAFYQLKQEIMNGNYTNATAQLETLRVFYQANTALIGNSISTNMIDKISLMNVRMSDAANSLNSKFLDINNTIQSTLISTLNNLIQKLTEVSNMKFDVSANTSSPSTPSNNSTVTSGTTSSSSNQQAYLDSLQSGSNAGAANWANQYEYLNNLSKSDNDGAAKWAIDQMKKNGMKQYHTGGKVGGSSDGIGDAIHKAFNLNDSEELAKLLKGEVVVNPSNFKPVDFAKGLIRNIKLPDLSGISKISKITPVQPVPTINGGITFSFPGFSGTKNEGKKAISYMTNELKKLGFEF